MSPILDFTLDLYTALFFATNELDEPKEQFEEIDEYFSIYYFDTRDSEFCSVQDVEGDSAARLNHYATIDHNLYPNHRLDTRRVANPIQTLSYNDYKGIPYIKVDGNDIGTANINIPAIDLTCSYDMSQPRIAAQHGLFICNNKCSTPLEKLVNQNIGKRIHCLNIKKSLAGYIKEKMLQPKGICWAAIYPEDKDSNQIKRFTRVVHKMFDPTERKCLYWLWILSILIAVGLIIMAVC